MIPDSFWTSLITLMTLLSIFLLAWIVSHMFKNIMSAFQKPIVNNFNYELRNCTLLEPGDIRGGR